MYDKMEVISVDQFKTLVSDTVRAWLDRYGLSVRYRDMSDGMYVVVEFAHGLSAQLNVDLVPVDNSHWKVRAQVNFPSTYHKPADALFMGDLIRDLGLLGVAVEARTSKVLIKL